jgi:serine/threonine-protein kinase
VTQHVLDSRYELIERIASGGMGEVWRGVDQILGRPVAIKLLSAPHAGDEQFRARFRAEARYAASLSHPGIARVYDYGESSPLGGPYLVMELVNGEPLSAILERVGRLPPDTTLDIVSQAARALDVAHQAGIVHRDIKPGNLLIMPDGTTKITDFGIAKARAAHEVNLTATGIVMGTAMYVSPEQATGSPVTGSSDIYSLGVVAYECLAGQPPFVAEQPLAIAIMHKHDPVPPMPPDVPASVRDLVLGMLAKNPEARPETALHLADRAEVIRDALFRPDGGFTSTADLPVVPEYSTATEGFSQFPERPGGSPEFQGFIPPGERSPLSRVFLNRRRLAAAGMGVAICGVGAVVAVVLSSGGHPVKVSGETTSPPTTVRVEPPTTASVRTSQADVSATGTNLESVPQQTAGEPAASRGPSPAPTHDAPPTSTAPTASKSVPPPPTTQPATPPVSATPTTNTPAA